jgi:hypothetical protein
VKLFVYVNKLKEQTMKINSLAATFTAFVASAQLITADTVLWYRFEEHDAGYVMTSSDRVTNEVDAETLIGTPKSGYSAKWPRYVATPQGCGAIYDPVTGQMHANNTAVNLPGTSQDEANFNINSYRPPRIETPDNVALHLQSFTVEMFVSRIWRYRGANEALVSKQNDGGAKTRCSYMIYRDQPGSNTFQFQVRVSNGEGSYSVSCASSAIANGSSVKGSICTTSNFWDHVAITFDAETRKETAYVNYVKVGEKTFNEGYGMEYADFPLIIGASGASNGSYDNIGFGGNIDEFRISDVALAPSQFLRMCSPVALPETTHFYTFEAPTNFSWNSTWPWRNLAPVAYEGSGKSMALYKRDYPTVGQDSDTTPGATVRSGLLADASAENDVSFHTSTNQPATDATSAYFKAFGRKRFFATDFTFEMAFKMPPQPTSAALSGADDSSFLVFAGLWGIRVFRGANKQLSFYDGYNYDLGRYTDSEWHRLAYVFEKASGEHRIYIDGVQKLAKTRSRNPDTDNDDWYLLSDGNWWGKSWGLNLSAGWIDDVRVTEKALRPHEFLTSVPKEDNGNVLAWYSFENDSLANGVYDDFIGAGALSAGADFSTKTPGGKKEIRDSERNKIRDNFKSLEFAGGKAVWPRNSILERKDMTVEFFARQKSASPGAGLVTLLRSDTGTNSTALAATDAIWSVRVGNDGRTPEVYVNNGTAQTIAFPANAVLGGWRQYAVSFIPDGGDTTVKIFCDNTLVKTGTVTGALQIPSANGGAIPVVGGTSGGADIAFNGNIDEVRISAGEVAIADMLYAPGEAGTIFTVR